MLTNTPSSNGKRRFAFAFMAAFVVGCTTEPTHPLGGTWKGSAPPASGGGPVQASVTLLPDGPRNATGVASFTTGDPIRTQTFSVDAFMTATDSVGMLLTGTAGGQPAFFEGRVLGETIVGNMTGNLFGSPPTHIVLIRQP